MSIATLLDTIDRYREALIRVGGGVAQAARGLRAISPDQMQELTKAAAAGAVGPLADKIVELSQKLGVTQDATVTFLHILGQQEVPLESLGQKLHEVAENTNQRWTGCRRSIRRTRSHAISSRAPDAALKA